METLEASDIMSKPAHTITPEATLSEAAGIMLDVGIGSLVVTGEDGRIVARHDLLEAMKKRLSG